MKYISVLVVCVILFLLDFYVFRGVKSQVLKLDSQMARRSITIGYWALSIGMYACISVSIVARIQNWEVKSYTFFYYLAGVVILTLIPKLVMLVFLLIDDIGHLMQLGVKKVSGSGTPVSRRHFVTQVGIILAAVPFFGILYGILFGRFNFKIRQEQLSFDSLPAAFEGLKVVQISDMHIGSFFNNYGAVQKGVDMINDLDPDIILFTGDMVNNYAWETDGWQEVLGGLNAKLGKYSVLGNHDYGEYGKWESEADMAANLQGVKDFHKAIGFDLLLNENRQVEKDGAHFNIIGVENWGLPPFMQYGDLDLAYSGIRDTDFNLLMSHDPSHWEEQVLGKKRIELTLSGHTHGMQFGVELGNIKWSPVKYKYKRWGGLYQELDQLLYVNRGFGYLVFPGRIGMPPEITLLEFNRA